MILPVIVITLAATVASQTSTKTLTNESSLADMGRSEDGDVDTYEDSTSVTGIEMENICKRVVISNNTRLITFRIETRKKCLRQPNNCTNGYEWVRSVGYRNLTETQRRSEHVCCDGFRNDSGKCVRDLSNSTFSNTSSIAGSEITENMTILIIVLPVAGAVVLLVLIVVIYKLKSSRKRPSDGRASSAHDNPIYDSTAGQSIHINNTVK